MKFLYGVFLYLVTLNIAWAQTSYVWNGSTSTDWNTATNWTPNGIPLASDHVTVVTGANNCILDANRTISNLTITSGTLNLNTFTLNTTGIVACNGGSCTNGIFNSTATTLTFAGTTFGAHVVANVTDVYLNGSTFNGNLSVVRTNASNIQSNGNNTYNGTTSITNAGSGYLLLTNGGAGRNETFNGPTTFRTTGTGQLYIGYSQNVAFNANVVVDNPSGTGFIQIGRLGSVNLNTGITITCTTFAGASLHIYGLVQANATPQVFSPGNNGSVNIYRSNFSGTLTVNAGYITAQTSTFAQAVTYNMAGTTGNSPSSGGNTYNGVLRVTNTSSGYIGFANGAADTYNADVYLTNTSTGGGRIIMGQNSTNNVFNGNIYISQSGTTNASGIAIGWGGTFPVVSLAATKSVILNGAYSSGYLQLLRIQQADATAISLPMTGTTSLTLQQNIFTGSVNFTAADITCYGGTYNGAATFTKTGGGNNHNNGFQNIFNATCTINLTSNTGYFMLGYNSNDFFNDDITVTSTGSGGINLGWYNGTGAPTLAAGKTIKVGGAGFSDGYLRLGGFTQLGNAAINLLFTSMAALYVERTGGPCTFGGTFTATAPDLYIRGGVFNGATTFTKIGGTDDHNNGGQNIFNATLAINQQSSGGYFMLGYNSNDLFNDDITLTGTAGSRGVYLGFSSGTGTPTLATGKTVKIGGAGFAGSFLYLGAFTQLGSAAMNLTLTGANAILYTRNSTFGGAFTATSPSFWLSGSTFQSTVNMTKTGANGDPSPGGNTFTGISQFTNTGAGYFGFGWSSPDIWNADVTFVNNGSERIVPAWNAAGNQFNGNITVTSTGSSTGIHFGGGGGSATLAAGKSINTGTFDRGYLILNRFTQLGNASNTLSLTTTANYLQYGPSSTFGGNVTSTSPGLYFHGATFNGTVDAIKTGPTGDYSNGGNVFNGVTTITNNGTSFLLLGNVLPDTWNADVTFTNNSNERLLPCWATAGNVFNGNIYVNTSGSAQGIQFCGGNGTATATLAATKTIAAGASGLNAGYLILRQFTQLGNAPITLSLGASATYLQFGPLSTFGGNITSTSPGVYFHGATFNGTVDATKTGISNDASSGGNIFNASTTITNNGSGYVLLGNGTSDQFNAATIFNNTGSHRFYFAYNHVGQTTTFASDLTLNSAKTGGADGWSFFVGLGINTGMIVQGNFVFNTSGSVQSNSQFLTNTGSFATYNGNVTLNMTNSHTSTVLQMGTVGTSTYNGNIVVSNTAGGSSSGIFFNTGNTSSSTLAPTKTITLGAGGFVAGTLSLIRFTQLGATPQTLLQPTGTAQLILGPTTLFDGNVNFNFPQVYLNGTTYNGTATIEKNGASDNYGSGGNTFNSSTTITNSGSGYLLTGGSFADQFNGSTTFNNIGASRMYVAHNHNNQTTTFASDVTFYSNKTTGTDTWGYLIAEGINVSLVFNGPVTITMAGTLQNNFRILQGSGTTATYNGDLTVNQINSHNSTQIQMGTIGTSTYNGNIVVSNTAGSTGNGIFFNNGLAASSTLAATKTISLGVGGFVTGTLSLLRFTQLGATPQTMLQPTGAALLILGPTSRFDGNVNFNFPRVLLNGTTYNGTATIQKNGSIDDAGSGGNIFNGTTVITNSGSGYLMTGNGTADQFNGSTTFNNTGSYRLYIAHNHNGQTTTFGSDVTFNSAKTGVGDVWSYFMGENFNTHILFNGSVIFNVSGSVQSHFRILSGGSTTATYNGDLTINMTNSHNATQLYMGSSGISTYNGNIIVSNTLGGSNSGVYFNTAATATSTLANTKTISLGAGGFVAGTLSLLRFTQLGATPQTMLQPTGAALLILGPTSRFDGNVNFNFPRVLLNGTTYNGTATIQKNGSIDDAGSGGNIFNGTTVITNSSSGYLMTGNGTADQFNGSTTFNNTGSYRMFIAFNHNGQTTTFGSDVTFNAAKTGGADGWAYFIAENFNTHVAFNGPVTFNVSGSVQSYCRILQGGSTTATYNGDLIINMTNSHVVTQVQIGAVGTSTYNGNIIVSNTAGGAGGGVYFNNSASATSTLANTKAISLGAGGFTTGTLSLLRFTQLGATPQTMLQPTGAALLILGPTSRFDGNVNFNFPRVLLNGTIYNGTATIQKNGSIDDAGSGGNIFNGTTVITNSGSGYLMTGNGTADQFNGSTTFNNMGSYRILLANSHNGQTTTFGSDVTFNSAKTGVADAWSYFISEGANSFVLFNGPVTFNVSGSVQSNCRLLNGSGTTATYNGDLTLNMTNTNVSTQMLFGTTGVSTYNGNISVTNTGGANGVYFNSGATASSTMATTKAISVGAGGFVGGSLSLARFTQLGTAPNMLPLTGASTLTFGPVSTFGGDVTSTSGSVLFTTSTFNGTVNSTKNGTVNDASSGGNTFNGSATFTDNGTGYLLMANTASDTYNGNVTFAQNNTGIVYPNYNTNCTYAGNISVASTGVYTITFGAAGSGIATLTGGAAQTINKSGTAANPIFTRLVVNKSANDVTLNTRINISGALTLTQGLMRTTQTNILNMNNASTTSIGSAISYIDGPMNYEMGFSGSRTLNFPIGKATDWRPAVLTAAHNNGTFYTYNAEVFNGNANTFGWTKPATISHVSTFHYWDINRTATATGVNAPATNILGNQTITLYYDTSDEVSDPTKLTICKNTSTALTTWVDIGGSGATAPTGSVTSTSSPTAFTSYSRFTIANKIDGFNPLPVTLLNFTATCGEGKVNVVWNTTTQIKNDYFTVERSSDGVDFQSIGNIAGAGTNSQLMSYSFTDKQPLAGRTYYRLKQTDLNGDYSYSKIITVSCTGDATIDMVVYPNPATDRITIQASRNELSRIRIYNALGQDMRTQVQILNTTPNGMELDIRALQTGIYVLKTKTAVHKIYKQ